jgi:4-diphosphocytidyl-2-C-methyl-D-erythritol kinase
VPGRILKGLVSTLVIPSPAKINLLLKVTGRRADGYHEIVTLLSRISLFDTVILTFDQPGIRVQCTHPHVPENSSNLACRAASSFFRALSVDDGVAIFIDKVIPVAAGLGGGSSNAAAVLLGLNEQYGTPLNEEALMDLASGIGADVPFFLFRHPAVARGIGDQLELYEGLPRVSVALVCPRFEVPTAWVYKNLKLGLTNYKKDFKIPPLKTLNSRNKHFLFNDLEQVTVGKFSEIRRIKRGLRDLGAEIALMSGSGPSVFGLFKDVDRAAKAVEVMRNAGERDAFLVELLLPPSTSCWGVVKR